MTTENKGDSQTATKSGQNKDNKKQERQSTEAPPDDKKKGRQSRGNKVIAKNTMLSILPSFL